MSVRETYIIGHWEYVDMKMSINKEITELYYKGTCILGIGGNIFTTDEVMVDEYGISWKAISESQVQHYDSGMKSLELPKRLTVYRVYANQ